MQTKRGKINQYAKRKEDKAEQRLINLGFVLVEDTGRRTTGKGDRIMYHEDTGITIMIDNKSTQNEKSFRILKEQLEKIKREAARYPENPLPAIIFSFFGDDKMYIIFNLNDLNGVMY